MKAEKSKSTSPRLSSLLNNNNNNNNKSQVDTPMKEYLPTPVTPATDFSQFHNKKDTSAYSTFSVIKPPPSTTSPTTPTAHTTAHSTTTTTTRSNTTNDVKPYPCPECHQTFSRPHNLKSHLTTHSSERPFQCDVCNHHFRRHHDLKRHQKLHTGERPYVCKDCYRSFARLDALNRHRRAEGGTACSAVHQQVKQELEVKQNLNSLTNATYRTGSSKISNNSGVNNNNNNNNNTSTSTSTPSPQRPVIPQLHIPHPASHLYPKDNHAHTSPIPPTHSPPPSSSSQATATATAAAQSNQLLPSPSALSSLPIANNNNLTPIYQPKSLPNTPSSPTKSNKLYHPYQPWSAYRNSERPTLPPLSASPPANYSPKSLSNLDRLLQENDELKRDINQIRAMAQKEAGSLKSRVHDLEVENKVLRSLIHNPSKNDSSCKSSFI
ncbi:hypothetical protein BDF21DRAFT_432488 [Thamnidium elegans]|nr:hypothetical protein BDF21DRAFT_432488 [Thamnidium elegans]